MARGSFAPARAERIEAVAKHVNCLRQIPNVCCAWQIRGRAAIFRIGLAGDTASVRQGLEQMGAALDEFNRTN